MSFKWYGQEITNKIEMATLSGLEAAAITVEADASLLCPVDDGRLRASINHRTRKKPDGNFEALVGTNVDYAIWVEYGTGIYAESGNGRKTPWVYYNEKLKSFIRTRGNAPQPFLRKAADKNRATLSNVFTAQFRKMFK